MNKESRSSLPDESKTEELLAKIQPVPSKRFHQNMQQAAWRMHEGNAPVTRRLRPQLALVILSMAALTALFITPQGRAWAQELFQFFGKINSSTVELPPGDVRSMQEIPDDYDLPLVPVILPTVSPEMATLPGCETPQTSQSYTCQVALAESELGFDLKELPALPEGWKFEVISYSSASKSATIGYLFDISDMSFGVTSGTLHLIQGTGALPDYYQQSPWSVVPADKVETVKVGEYNGEYVMGSFTLPTGSDSLVWDASDHHKRLAWSDGTRWYLIEIWRNLNRPDTMDRDRLIALAESLVDSPVETTDVSDPGYLYSVSEAEKISGIDLKAPTLLPLDLSFSHARYYADSNEVRLYYGFNNELVIHQWTGKSLNPNSNYENVQIHGERAFYGFVDGADPLHFLSWEQDGVTFQLQFYEILGKLDKEKMVAIAESLQDIDDFRKKESKPYEYVSVYGEALGIDVLEFPEPPAGWSFANVWADPGARCILTIYKSVTEPGYLWIDQCHTAQRFNISDIPSSQTHQVSIGGYPGIYVQGDFSTDGNGKLSWNPDALLKQAYWQKDGSWIKMILSGESAALHTREDLITYAERLR